MRKQRFELVYGKSAKFWEVSVTGLSMTTIYGRIGSKGKRTDKKFSSPEEAKKALDRLIRQKIDKGYTQVTTGASRKRSTSKPAATSHRKADARGKPAKKGGDDRRSIDEVRSGAKAGNAADQAELGYRYAKGKGVRRSYKFAAKWFDAAAQQGNPRAQVNLGLLYLAGKGVEQDSTKGENWIKKAADQGFADAQYNLGFFASKGSIGPVTAQDLIDIFEAEADEKDEKRRARNKRAADWYRLAADQGHAEAQVALGKCYLKGLGVPQNYEEAVRWLESASSDKENDADLADAYYRLGQSVENGKYVAEEWLGYKLPYAQLIRPDPRGAIPVYKKASGSGNLDAAFRLGAIYKNGLGIRRNYRVAARWLQKAADGGIPEAQYDIGDLYWDGRGVNQNRKKALRWWRAAASKGIAKAVYRIAEAHASGTGIRRNSKEAERWYLKAAEMGHPDAQYVMGDRHLASAKGGKRKIAQALKWYRRAAEAGHVDARRKLTKHYADPTGKISKLHKMIDEFAATREDDEIATEWLIALRESICLSWSAICVPIEDFEEDRTSSMIGGWPVITNRYPSLPAEWAPMLQLDLTDITKVTGEVVGDGWLQLWMRSCCWGQDLPVEWSKAAANRAGRVIGGVRFRLSAQRDDLALRVIPRSAVTANTRFLAPKRNKALVGELNAWQKECESKGRPFAEPAGLFWDLHAAGNFLPWRDEPDMNRPLKIAGWQPSEKLLSCCLRDWFDYPRPLNKDAEFLAWIERFDETANSLTGGLEIYDKEACKNVLLNYRSNLSFAKKLRPFPHTRSLFSFNGPAERWWVEDIFDVVFARRSGGAYEYGAECTRWKW